MAVNSYSQRNETAAVLSGLESLTLLSTPMTKNLLLINLQVLFICKSVVALVQSLPVDNQEKIKQEMSASGNNSEKIEEIIKKYFTEEQRTKALEPAAKSAIVDYLKSINDSLSSTQKQTEVFQAITPLAE